MNMKEIYSNKIIKGHTHTLNMHRKFVILHLSINYIRVYEFRCLYAGVEPVKSNRKILQTPLVYVPLVISVSLFKILTKYEFILITRKNALNIRVLKETKGVGFAPRAKFTREFDKGKAQVARVRMKMELLNTLATSALVKLMNKSAVALALFSPPPSSFPSPFRFPGGRDDIFNYYSNIYASFSAARFAADFRRKHYKYQSSVTSSQPRAEISPEFPRARQLLERVMTHVEVRTSKA